MPGRITSEKADIWTDVDADIFFGVDRFSGFFMAANPSASSGLQVTYYIDALFMCVSAFGTAGLSTISISATSRAQQAFIFLLMIVGDIVSYLMRSGLPEVRI